MTMAHQPRTAVVRHLAGMGGEERGQFRFHRLFEQLARAGLQDVGQRVRRKSRWIGQRRDGRLRHVAYPFLC